MKSSRHFDDHEWRNGSTSAYDDFERSVVVVEYDDNLLFDDEVVGQAIAWPEFAPPPPFQRVKPTRTKSRRQ